MTDIVPVPNWGGVRQLETNEYATGGLNGNMNEQAKSLAGQNMYARLYAGLPFDPVFTAQVGGFPIGGKVALENGDIVRSAIVNNANNPNIDMAGWVPDSDFLTVNPRVFGAKLDGVADDSEAFQLAADALQNGGVFRAYGLAKLKKQTGKHTDIYGADGRSYGRLTLNGGQPCLIFREKNDITIDLRGVELFTETYGQGIIDLYKCTNVTIIGGKLTGGMYIRNEGRYAYIPLDGTTGAGDKGGASTGFNTTTLNPDIGNMRNNAVITQNETSGGYGGAFPQFGGGTAATWGVWRGGQIGNYGIGITVIGGKNIRITQTEIHGFDNAAIMVGLERSTNSSTSYPRISNPESRSLTPESVIIEQNYLHHCYSGGVQSDRSLHLKVLNNVITDMGHPDCSLADTNVDPGYGFATSRSMPNFDFEVSGNYFLRCYRKGIDSHQGSSFNLSGNKIVNTKFHGIGIAIDDDYVDPYYQPYFDHVAIVKDNDVTAHSAGIFYANGQFGRKRREGLKLRWEQLHVVIEGNSVKSTAGFYFNYGHCPFKIINNTFTFAAPFANEKTPTGTLSGMYLGSLARGLVVGDTITNNTFRNSKDGNFQNCIFVDASYNETKGTIITGNVFNITPWYYVASADSQYAHNDVVYRSSFASAPIAYNANRLIPNGVIEQNVVTNDFHHPIIFGGGGSGAVAYPKIDMNGRIDGVQLLSGGTGYNGTITATITNKAKSAGATLSALAADGVITSVDVVSSGRFYKNTYTYELARGFLEYDMNLLSSNSCINTSINKRDSSSLFAVSANGSALDSPFSTVSNVGWAKTTAANQQYLLVPVKYDNGAISFWFKIASGQPNGAVSLLSPNGSADGSNNNAGAITATILADGFTLSSATSVDGVAYVSGTKLSFDTPYHFVINGGIAGANIVFGANNNLNGGFFGAEFAFIKIHRAITYSIGECSDLFQENRTLFGK